MPGPMPVGPVRRGIMTQPENPTLGGPGMQLNPPILGGFKKGGKVKKTGLYRLHKGERVIKAGAKMKLKDLV
jgi:hypothetical protein